ncbi:nucleotidyltransferase family protein [Pseudohaliea rubra]|uniref:nucleotidyltransferase family protein n=1 Tax=Pseudohaliea rubra TaxID=475795 RepID=UPI00054F74A2|nr:nucleotidyltransferase domain-containing protein [Pseudohaliea rubra]
MTLRLSEAELAFLDANVVQPLHQAGYRVSCFGSRARGGGAPYADVDLLIEGSGKPRQLVGEINEKLTESNFPYKVDLVLEADLAESYRDGVMREKIPLRR